MNLQNLPCIIRLYICYNYIWRAYVTPGPGVCLVHHSQASRQHSCLRVQLGMGSGIGAKSTVLIFCLSKNGKPMKFPQLWEKLGLYADTSTTSPQKESKFAMYIFIYLFIYLSYISIYFDLYTILWSNAPLWKSTPMLSVLPLRCSSPWTWHGFGPKLGEFDLLNQWPLYKLAKCLNHKPQTQRITIRTWPAQRSACMI